MAQSKNKWGKKMLDERLWLDDNYRQRTTTKVWKEILLDERDKIIYRGKMRQLKADNLGYGVVEIYKEPLMIVTDEGIEFDVGFK